MTETNPRSKHHLVVRIIAVLFLICMVFLIFLGTKMIRQQVRQMVGEPADYLSTQQIMMYEATFFVNQGRILQPANLSKEAAFTINNGELLDDVINQLKYQGIISDGGLFRSLLIYSGADRRILPGKYLIPAGSSLVDVAARLQDINSSLVDFVILPGWRKEEIAEALPTSGLAIPMDEFLSMVNQPITDPDLADAEIVSHEGFLAPGRYSFRRDVSLGVFISAFVNHSKQLLSEKTREAFSGHGLTTYQAVILASIIQREAIIDSEKPMIASVFLNRLQQGMPLQSDPTVQYSLGYSQEWGWWKSPLSLQDLQVNSPYNTYIINGLPPAPISNPDETSLQAVANPEESTYLYFRAACDASGNHVFSETIEEHTMNGCAESGS
jgi:UPF0755 protein